MIHLRLILLLILTTIASVKGYAESKVDEIVEKPKNLLTDEEYYKQFRELFEFIDKNYVQIPDKQKMINEAINGMLSALDPHSNYFTDEDLDDLLTFTKGEFGGIGVEILYDKGAFKVISSIDDLPAYKAGIKSGDYIVGVNGELVSSLGHNKGVKEMRGKPGTKVKLLIIKEGETKPQEVDLTREIVKINPVKAHLEKNNIAYIRIITFNELTASELKLAMTKLKKEADNNIKGIILDLRNNVGGILDQAVAVSEYFIDSGLIVTTTGRASSNSIKIEANTFVPKAPKVPIVTLINGSSASASEIVAGALQDHKRALLIGTKSFGKGSVQSLSYIHSGAAVKLTTAKYYTPSGRSIQATGIEPDIIIEPAKVEFPDSKKLELKFSESSLKNYIKHDVSNDNKEETKSVGNNNNELSKLYKEDYQFARAYDVISALIIYDQNNQSIKSAPVVENKTLQDTTWNTKNANVKLN